MFNVKDFCETIAGLDVMKEDDVLPTFSHGERSWENYIRDHTTGVLISLFEPIIADWDVKKSGYIEKSYPISILFADKSELEYTPDQHDVIIQRMLALAQKFVIEIQRRVNDTIRSYASIRVTEVKNMFDSNVSGAILDITLVPLDTNLVC